MKYCPRCKQQRALHEFYKDGASSYCRPCNREYGRMAYLRHKADPDWNKARGKKDYQTFRAHVDAHKCAPCADCGVAYPSYVMDFDHVRGQKVRNISSMASCSRTAVEAEIAKCDVVCANCHRERTHQRAQGH